jgi:hypothetical protein
MPLLEDVLENYVFLSDATNHIVVILETYAPQEYPKFFCCHVSGNAGIGHKNGQTLF